MDKQEYLRKHLDELFRLWIRRAALWGCVLFLLLGGLDYVVVPERFWTFLTYRIFVSAVLLAAYFATARLPQRCLSTLTICLVLLCAAAIELMILQFGGHESPYYVGMILLGVSVTGFIPGRFRFHVAVSFLIYLVYLFPLLASEPIAGHGDFITDNAFIVLIFATMLLVRYLSGKTLVADLELAYDLERYRDHLEEIVHERTSDLASAVVDLEAEIAERKKAEGDRQRLQGHFLQAQKMESIGRLAGGVAHDFNNILTAILSYAELTLMKLPEQDPVREHVNAIREASERAATLTRQLLAFSRRQVLEMREIDLNAVVRGIASLVGRIIGEDIILTIETQAAIGTVRADQGQIEQVVMNLAVNARDAMPAGGRLTIRTETVHEDGMPPAGPGGPPPGTYVLLTMTDTGEGMTDDVRERIFDPFFTTKEMGRGTGLGLATVYGIVKQHGGFIDVESEPGKGASFRLYLPAVREEDRRSSGEQPQADVLPGGSETILVVEDDPAVGELVRDVLEPMGYAVLKTSSGEEALAASDAHAGPIHLLLTDVVMPGMNGKQLADMLRAKRPGLRVLFMTGYTRDALSTQGMMEPGISLIHKPLRPAMLARGVREALDSDT